MPIITIQQSPRSIELKREAARRVTDVVAEVYGMPRDAIQIFFDEYNHENWSKGGLLAVDKKAGKKEDK
ncbi:4-oxalocrotonate tautomerase [Halomonadaceae bacterium LMG 33818]|uniref:tautomerase family protein n=1 Tax=Cernens ardua TaxID=3402176 RepID=UPI003EDC6900